MSGQTITVELDELTVLWLDALIGAQSNPGATTIPEVLEQLAESAAAGARRSGAWERQWVASVFPIDSDPIDHVECEHDWQEMNPNNPLLQCRRCFTYRRREAV